MFCQTHMRTKTGGRANLQRVLVTQLSTCFVQFALIALPNPSSLLVFETSARSFSSIFHFYPVLPLISTSLSPFPPPPTTRRHRFPGSSRSDARSLYPKTSPLKIAVPAGCVNMDSSRDDLAEEHRGASTPLTAATTVDASPPTVDAPRPTAARKRTGYILKKRDMSGP